jgi:hypothetical protein
MFAVVPTPGHALEEPFRFGARPSLSETQNHITPFFTTSFVLLLLFRVSRASVSFTLCLFQQ